MSDFANRLRNAEDYGNGHLEKLHIAAAEEIDRLTQTLSEAENRKKDATSDLQEKCAVVLQALNDWAVTYAPDMCDDDTVSQAKSRILEHGTLAYIANASEKMREVIILLSEAEQREQNASPGWAFAKGDMVRKKSGSWWEGRVVGTYSTAQTPKGYCVQLIVQNGPVQIYPESALEILAYAGEDR